MTAIDDQFDHETPTISLDADLDTLVIDPERVALLERLAFDLLFLRQRAVTLRVQSEHAGVDIGPHIFAAITATIDAGMRQMGAL